MTALRPDMQAILDAMNAEPDVERPWPEARRLHDAGAVQLGGTPERVAEVRDLGVPGAAGEVPVRVYRPAARGDGAAGAPGAVAYLHGGGWCLGSLDGFDRVCRALANASGAVVVSVSYRLAPEHPFPAALDDTLAVLRWLGANAGELGADPARMAVAGDSAGGNLAAAAARRLRDEGGPALALQALIYPALDAAGDAPSHGELADGYGLTAEAMARFWRLYRCGADAADPDLSPLRARDLAGLPPAFVLLADHDPLRDEGAAYAAALRQAGVPATVSEYEGAIHGFVRWLGTTAQAREAVAETGAALAAALGR